MPESALAKKLKLKPGQHAAIVGAPAGYLDTLRPLPDGVELAQELDGTFDWVQVFVKNRAEFEALVPRVLSALKPESLLWILLPKGLLQDPNRPDARRGLGCPARRRPQVDHVGLGR